MKRIQLGSQKFRRNHFESIRTEIIGIRHPLGPIPWESTSSRPRKFLVEALSSAGMSMNKFNNVNLVMWSLYYIPMYIVDRSELSHVLLNQCWLSGLEFFLFSLYTTQNSSFCKWAFPLIEDWTHRAFTLQYLNIWSYFSWNIFENLRSHFVEWYEWKILRLRIWLLSHRRVGSKLGYKLRLNIEVLGQ